MTTSNTGSASITLAPDKVGRICWPHISGMPLLQVRQATLPAGSILFHSLLRRDGYSVDELQTSSSRGVDLLRLKSSNWVTGTVTVWLRGNIDIKDLFSMTHYLQSPEGWPRLGIAVSSSQNLALLWRDTYLNMLSSPVRGNTISGARAGISTKITQNSYKVPLDI
jgi:hypothetical protein